MRYEDLQSYYLCAIGGNDMVNDFRIGRYDEVRDSFSFSNGSCGATELYKKPVGSNSCYVISAVCLQKLDDKEMLYEPI